MKTKKTMLSARKKGARAKSILMALAQDAATGRLMHEDLRKEAEAPGAHEARAELAQLHELMQATRSEGLQLLANMRVSAGIPLH